MKLEYYKSIDTLPIWNFEKIKESLDLKYIVRAKEYDFKLNETNEETDIWNTIINEYMLATSHRQENRRYSVISRSILRLTIKHDIIKSYCLLLILDFNGINSKQAKEKLRSYGYKLKTIGDVELIAKRANNIKTQIREKQLLLEKEFGSTTEKKEFGKLAAKISAHDGIRYNTKKISVSEWIPIEDNYIESIKNGNRRDR